MTGKLFATAFTSPIYEQNRITYWNPNIWTIITDTVQAGTVLDIAFSPASRLFASSPDRYAIRVWDFENEQWLYTIYTSFTGGVTDIAFSPDGFTLASGHYDGTIALWDMLTGELALKMKTEEVIASLAFCPDGRLLSTGGSYANNLVRLWSSGSGALLHTLEGHTSGVDHLMFSPDGHYIITASYSGEIRLWGIRP